MVIDLKKYRAQRDLCQLRLRRLGVRFSLCVLTVITLVAFVTENALIAFILCLLILHQIGLLEKTNENISQAD